MSIAQEKKGINSEATKWNEITDIWISNEKWKNYVAKCKYHKKLLQKLSKEDFNTNF